MTRIVIAHRQETILNADIIYALQQGKLIDMTQEYKASFLRVGKTGLVRQAKVTSDDDYTH